LSLPGWVKLRRHRYVRSDGSSVWPIDIVTGLALRTVSLGVRELACRLSLDAHSFERAADNLQAAAQLLISVETLRRLVEEEGKRVVHAQNHEQLEFDWEAAECQTARPDKSLTSRMYISCDGVTVPIITHAEKVKRREKALKTRKALSARGRSGLGRLPAMRPGADQRFKEFKLVTVYDQDRERRAVLGTRGDHRQAGRLMRRLAGALHLGEAQEKVGVVDGAAWIAKQIHKNVASLDVLTLDFYHLSEHVHEVRVAVFGEQAPEGQVWAGDLLHAAKHQGYEPLWQGLVDLRAKTRSPTKRRAIDGLMQYVVPRQAMISYPQNQQRGWDIGSGPMESMCKALSRRLKGRGMRWDSDNAEAIMALEGLVQGQAWAAWWQKRLVSVN
jgi:hypothetical protein